MTTSTRVFMPGIMLCRAVRIFSGFLIGLLLLQEVNAQELPCQKRDGRNGSALCLQLGVNMGQVVITEYRFVPNASYENDKGLAESFAAEASAAIDRLPKPCLLAMTPEQRRKFIDRPGENADMAEVCNWTKTWADFVPDFLSWTASIGGDEDVLSESVLFRPLQTLYQRSPLLWIDTSNESLNAETGVVTFLIADRFDPRTLEIEIEGLEDADREAREVALRRWLNPLTNAVFCHEKIRAEIQSYYARIGVQAEIISLTPQGPSLRIKEGGR